MISKKIILYTILITLVTSSISGSIVYAIITQRLDVKGSTDFAPESWRVDFNPKSLSKPNLKNGALVDTLPLLSDTMITNYKISLIRPGSSAEFTFNIDNSGHLDSILTTYVLGNPACEGTNETKLLDESIVCSKYLVYNLKYESGDLTINGLVAGNDIKINDQLKKQTSVKVKLKLEYLSSAPKVPTNKVLITGLDSYLIYSSQ